ncbi:MAG TPA: hypothetical protein PK510_15480, partial [Ottowia sp.]|nr:hypothetical protein [Ottowia sp.]
MRIHHVKRLGCVQPLRQWHDSAGDRGRVQSSANLGDQPENGAIDLQTFFRTVNRRIAQLAVMTERDGRQSNGVDHH